GALPPLFYCFREREEILKIFEKYCGARLTTHAFRIGGLQYEAHDTLEKDVERFCKAFEPRIKDYEDLLTQNRIWLGRTKGVGILTAAEAKCGRSEEHTSELQSHLNLVCRLLLEKKNKKQTEITSYHKQL